MKTIALLSLLALTACASSDGFVDDTVYDCSPGQELGIQAGLDGPQFADQMMGDQLTMLVEVSNNSHADVTVTMVRVDPIRDDSTEYALESAYAKVSQEIAEGEAHLFRLPVRGARVSSRDQTRRQSSRPRATAMSVWVQLSDGDSYRCRFYVPVPG